MARALLQLPPPKAGSVLFDGNELTQMRGEALRGAPGDAVCLTPAFAQRDIIGRGLRQAHEHLARPDLTHSGVKSEAGE